MIHVIEHTLLDTLKVIPFLFITYLAMEYLEHKAGEKTQNFVKAHPCTKEAMRKATMLSSVRCF